jgi:hypothetical protein
VRNIDACPYVGPSDRMTLERLIADGKTPQKIVKWATVVFFPGRRLGTNPTGLHGGRRRAPAQGQGQGAEVWLEAHRRRGRLAVVTRPPRKRLETPRIGTRMLAEKIGVGHTTVHRIWKEHGLKPHLTRTFELSNNPRFAEKVVDVVRLNLNPPDKAVVLCVDEKSQIQALDARNRDCRSRRAARRQGRMTTSAMAQRRCSQPST